ncbi:MAG: sugar phosphate nucleotidyltransferase [Planctomycetota bacterium]|jgi:bifunctional UDP-N-acetylglucosamine pyrophosphorylase/glucosamine-1-phosphate N-acetyltransferase
MTDNNPTTQRGLASVILAAGQGTRMGSDLPKVLHPVADRALVHWVLDACEASGSGHNVVIVGHQAEKVREELNGREGVDFALQAEQLGTGHAVMQAAEFFDDAADTDVLVLCGDGPLIQADTIAQLVRTHRQNNAAATLATAVIDDPSGYGRIVRDETGHFSRIVEQKDASEDELKICEVNPSYYCFKASALFDSLKQINNQNANGEYYLTDVLGILVESGQAVAVVDAVPAEDVLSINTPAQLEEVDDILRRRLGAGAKS